MWALWGSKEGRQLYKAVQPNTKPCADWSKDPIRSIPFLRGSQQGWPVALLPAICCKTHTTDAQLWMLRQWKTFNNWLNVLSASRWLNVYLKRYLLFKCSTPSVQLVLNNWQFAHCFATLLKHFEHRVFQRTNCHFVWAAYWTAQSPYLIARPCILNVPTPTYLPPSISRHLSNA